MSVVFALWLREVRKFLRSRTQVIASLGQPLLYMGVLGFGLGPVFRRAGEGNYLQFMAPGVIAMTVLFTSLISGMTMLWDRQLGFLKETIVAPVPRLSIMLGRTLGAATTAIVQGTLTFGIALLLGLRPSSWLAIPAAYLVMMLIALVFSALATAVGSMLKDMQGFQLIGNFLMMPIFFLSGALYPLDGLPRPIAALTRIDPLTYGVDALRGTLIGRSHFSVGTDILMLLGVAVLFLVFGAWRFSKIEV